MPIHIQDFVLHVEALLFASDKPLSVEDLTNLMNKVFTFMGEKVSLEQVEKSLEAITEKYASPLYCFQPVLSGGGWQFLTKKTYHKTIATLNEDKYLKRLSGKVLEVMAIVAFMQPVTKAEIEALRGVSCDYALHKLLEKDLIIVSGRKEDVPGRPLQYITSGSFMNHFGIKQTEDFAGLRKEMLDSKLAQYLELRDQPTA